MEYDEVTRAEDFMTEERLIDNLGGEDLPDMARLSEDINLLYVAVTRTKQVLYIPETLLPQSLKNLSGTRSIVALEKTQRPGKGYQTGRDAFDANQATFRANKQAFKPGKETFKPGKEAFKSSKETFQAKRQKLQQANAPWSKADDTKLLKLYQQGKSPKELATIFDRSQGSISSRIRKLLMD
jgi:ATP-dependent exoDNAse (exonuclease V) beta subunit